MTNRTSILHVFTLLTFCFLMVGFPYTISAPSVAVEQKHYWLLLKRTSNTEIIYDGVPGDEKNSRIVKEFTVKTGRPNERPTPLPQVIGREYWVIVDKKEQPENPETAPYFLTLDVPVSEIEPFGPEPYLECSGQCNWVIPGPFGLHGINGDSTKLSDTDPGSSGCIRHTDEDITYLYNILDPAAETIRYYVKDI